MHRRRALQVTSKDHTVLSRNSLPRRPQRLATATRLLTPANRGREARLNDWRRYTAPTEVIRPGSPTVQAAQPPGGGTPGVQQPSGPASRFEGLLPLAGPPPMLGPVPNEQTKKKYGRFADGQIAPEDTIEVVAGHPIVKMLWEKPRRLYIPNEEFATCQIVTDRQIAIVGKKPGRTVLDIWFPDPRDPNDPGKDQVLSYMIAVLPDTEEFEIRRWRERKQLEAEWNPTKRRSRYSKGKSRKHSPTAQSNSRWWESRLWFEAKRRTLSKLRKSSPSLQSTRRWEIEDRALHPPWAGMAPAVKMSIYTWA